MNNPTPDQKESRFANHPRGFISIIALGIFTILAVFGIILSTMISRNLSTVQNTENYNIARDTAESVTDFLEKTLAQYEPGFSTGGMVSCVFNQAPAGVNRGPNARPYVGDPTFCEPLVAMVGNMKVTVNMEIKGRAAVTNGDANGAGAVNEKLLTTRCASGLALGPNRNAGDCYISPLPGTGDAGDRCDLYDPVFVGGNGGANLPNNLSNGIQGLDQLDYSCNWNRLTFGSSMTDRAAIPLYYATEAGDCSDPDSASCVNPYWSGEAQGVGGANKFLLRMRTPCLPCVYDQSEVRDGVRLCSSSDDPTVCSNAVGQRYELNEPPDDIVVQWQINGICEDSGEECGLISIGEERFISAITESKINRQHRQYQGQNDIVLDWLIDRVQNVNIAREDPLKINQEIGNLKKAVLVLFLTNELKSAQDKNIPYLEYQFLSDKPIGSGKTRVHATVNVDGNVFEKDLLIDIENPLIDFAIQN